MRYQQYSLVIVTAFVLLLSSCAHTPEVNKVSKPARVALLMSKDFNCSIQDLEEGAQVNTNRDYIFTRVDKELQANQFIQLRHNLPLPYQVEVIEPGIIYLLVNPKSQTSKYFKMGWQESDLDVSVNFDIKKFTVFERDAKKGEQYQIPRDAWISPIIVASQIELK